MKVLHAPCYLSLPRAGYMLMCSIWQYQLYAKLFPAWTPRITALVGPRLTAPVLTFIDQCIQ